ncbi:MAG: hypothetical protein HC908_09845 [Calothrix sp. SM1_7_51]|nr:hypothetical protein [Calothrix sp. SM1_7_51]
MVQIPEERELMATVYLKDGTKVEVPMDELGDYLEANRDNIQPRTIKRRGPVRSKLPETNPVG